MAQILSLLLVMLLIGCGGGMTAIPSPLLVTLGDSITAQGGYPQIVASKLGARLVNLGIGGEFTGPFDKSSDGVEIKYGGVLADEVPNIPTDATLVTLFIGTNDAWAFGVTQFSGYLDVPGTLANYRTSIAGILAGIRARAPRARIVVMSVPNQARRAASLSSPPQVTQLMDGMRQILVDTGLTLVDLEHDPAMYDEANFQGPYNVHPNAAGEAAIAKDVLSVLSG